MPRAKRYNPINPAQQQTVHLLSWPGLWDGAKVTTEIAVALTVKTGSTIIGRFDLLENGTARDAGSDAAKAKGALDLLKHSGRLA